jgi:hypothetical protein
MSIARTLIKLREFQTNSAETLAYGNEATTSTNVKNALDWLFAVLYPNTQDSVDTYGDLPAVGNTLNDYRVVLDDGDGKAAGYRWESREGDVAPQWYKIHDMDWSNDGILTALIDQTNELYVSKYGREDQDATGTPLTGSLAGQNIYGGTTANSNLTLHANAGDISDLPADQTGYIQFHGSLRPTSDDAFDMGTIAERFRSIFLAGDLTDGTAFASVQEIEDAFNHSITTSGNPHNVSYNELSSQLGVLTVDGDASGTVDLSTSGVKTLTLAVADDSHNHTGASLPDFDADVYLKAKTILKDSSQITWSFNDGLEEATPSVAVDTGDITDIDAPAVDKILVGNAAGNAWVTSSGLIELTGDATGSATYDSATDKWSITTTVGSSSLAGVTDVELQNKTFTSVSGTPTTITATAHGLLTGETVTLYGAILTGAKTITFVDANTFTVPDTTGSADSGYYIPNGAQLLWDPSLNKFKIAKEYEEIRLGELAGLTEDVLSIYVAKDGRSGGQTVNGGISASQNLTLESTTNATKGSILFASKATPVNDAAYSGGWSGTDLGSSGKRFNDLYMAGEIKGARFENVGSLPISSGTTIGKPVYYAGSLYVDTGSLYVKVGSSDVAVTTKIADYTALTSDDVILVNATSGAITITLPTAVSATRVLKIKKTDSSANAVTIDGNGSETIDGAITYAIENQFVCISIVSDGTSWHIV